MFLKEVSYCVLTMVLFVQKYNKKRNIVNYYYNLKKN